MEVHFIRVGHYMTSWSTHLAEVTEESILRAIADAKVIRSPHLHIDFHPSDPKGDIIVVNVPAGKFHYFENEPAEPDPNDSTAPAHDPDDAEESTGNEPPIS